MICRFILFGHSRKTRFERLFCVETADATRGVQFSGNPVDHVAVCSDDRFEIVIGQSALDDDEPLLDVVGEMIVCQLSRVLRLLR